ncbi:hypothetical protein GGI12_002609 [Dipsacomyces acuminosporus]|nr:hypothetical protein GGI12_002609 [Dipsacomyces acuminosporus]
MSLAQNLPKRIVECIISYLDESWDVVGTRHFRENGDYPLDHLVPFLGACKHWKSVACPMFYKRAYMDFEYSDGSAAEVACEEPCILDIIDFKAENLVEEVSVFIPYSSDIFAMSQALSAEPYKDAVLPAASKLRLLIYHSDPIEGEAELAMFQQHLSIVATHLHRMMPNLRACDYQAWFEDCPIDTRFVGILTSKLETQTIKEFMYKHYHYEFVEGELPQVDGLTWVHLGNKSINQYGVELVQRNAQTLQKLGLDGISPLASRDLVHRQDGTLVVYLQLLELCIISYSSAGYSELQPISGTPFPSLVRVSCPKVYPFSDDILFRGNSRTLAHLRLELGAEALSVINKHCVFGDSSFTELRYVEFTAPGTESPSGHEDGPSIAKVPFDTCPRMQVVKLELPDWFYMNTLQTAISSSMLHQNIQVLDIPHVRLSLFDFTDVLGHLPSLVQLSAGIKHEEPPIPWPPSSKYIELLVDTHCPASKSLKILRLTTSQGMKIQHSAERLCMLALLLPRLTVVYADNLIRDFYRRVIEKRNYKRYFRHLSSVKLHVDIFM